MGLGGRRGKVTNLLDDVPVRDVHKGHVDGDDPGLSGLEHDLDETDQREGSETAFASVWREGGGGRAYLGKPFEHARRLLGGGGELEVDLGDLGSGDLGERREEMKKEERSQDVGGERTSGMRVTRN